jgi:hypothetical protein
MLNVFWIPQTMRAQNIARALVKAIAQQDNHS